MLAYAFFATRGTLDFARFRYTDISFYVQLQQGFYHGHLYMDFPVDPRLAALPNPYDPAGRAAIFYPWDSSYFRGHYYLYHSALPVLLGYVPLHLLLHRYPPDQLIAMLFCTWAFLASVLFVRGALRDSERPRVPFFLWVLFLGLGNAIPFVLPVVHSYEVAIACGMAMTASWAVAMLRLLRAPSAGRAAWMGVWLALAIAARPDLIVLGIAAAAALVIAFRTERARLIRAACAFAAPLAVVATAMLWYNAARFGDPLEFGVRYQLTSVDMRTARMCGVRNVAEAVRFGNNVLQYVFLPPAAQSQFPFLNAQLAALDPAVSWPTPGNATEQVIGLAPLMPLAVIGAVVALLFAFVWRGAADARVRAAIMVMAGAWLILAALSTCWWIVARYTLDYMLLMAAASVVLSERALALLPRGLAPRLIVAALAVYSVAAGTLLGFSGPGGAFDAENAARVPQPAARTMMPAAAFDRILLPVWFPGIAQGGSTGAWQCDLVVHNAAAHDVPVRTRPGAAPVLTIAPDATLDNPPLNLGWAKNGALLYVPRGDAAALHFNLHLHPPGAAGIVIPVLPEAMASSSTLHFIDVPLDDNSRATVRVYDLTGSARQVTLRAAPLEGGAATERDVPLDPGAPPAAEVNLAATFPELRGRRVRLEVQPPSAQFWAFVSVTRFPAKNMFTMLPE